MFNNEHSDKCSHERNGAALMPIFARAPYSPRTNRLAGMPLFATPLLNGDAGVSQTVAKMRELIDQALRDPQIKALANNIVHSVPPHDDMAEAMAVYQWVLSNIRFTKDPINKETLFPPSELLRNRAGDCDDFTMLIATLLMAIGINARAITVSAPSEDTSQFSHIYPEAQIDGSWVPLDAARPDASFGTAPAMYYRMRAWSLTDSSYQDLNGINPRGSRQGALAGTKVYAHPGSTVHLHGLGAYPRFRSLRGVGDMSTPQLVSTIANDATSIWKSFETPFTPTAPPAGYVAPAAASSSSALPLLLLVAAGAFLLMRG